MKVGVPGEIKDDESRVVPVGARALCEAGHTVYVQQGASVGAGVPDEDYLEAGALITDTADEVYAQADMIVKVKEPQMAEMSMVRENQILFTYFHFAANAQLAKAYSESGAIAIAYETVEDEKGYLPLLIPMSEIAGRLAVQEGAKYLEAPQGGRGVLLSGLPGVAPADVVILGAGVVGQNAARIAAGMGASVHLLDVDVGRLRRIDHEMPANVTTLISNTYNLDKLVYSADLLIGAVLVPGTKAPTLVNRAMISGMKKGSVIVDVAVDQGGCVETMRPTTHHDPTFVVDEVVHCGITNLPGAVPRTATMALCNATMPYVLEIANVGWQQACHNDAGLAHGLNVIHGNVTPRRRRRECGSGLSSTTSRYTTDGVSDQQVDMFDDVRHRR